MVKKAKQALDNGDFLLVEIIEQASAPGAVSLQTMKKETFHEILPHFRTYVAGSCLCWLLLAQDVLENGTEFVILPENDSYPGIEEMVGHATRTFRQMETEWPHETAFVKKCLPDLESAKMMIQQSPVFNGMAEIGSFLPDGCGLPGIIVRHPSPVSYVLEPVKQ